MSSSIKLWSMGKSQVAERQDEVSFAVLCVQPVSQELEACKESGNNYCESIWRVPVAAVSHLSPLVTSL